MINILTIVEIAVVFIYGLFLTAAFAGVLKDKKNLIALAIFYIFIFAIQPVIYNYYGVESVRMIYPLIVHLPVVLFLVFYCKKSVSTAIVALIAGYFCTIPRSGIAVLVAAMFHNSVFVILLTRLLVTVPLIFLICRYVVPIFTAILKEHGNGPWFFSTLIILQYCFLFPLSCIGNVALIQIIYHAFGTIVIVFNVIYFKEFRGRSQLEKRQLLMVQQEKLWESELARQNTVAALMFQQRHDAHHHNAVIMGMLESGNADELKAYMRSFDESLDMTNANTLCKHPIANSIFNLYARKAEAEGIKMVFHVSVPEGIGIDNIDLTCVLGNALENALEGCMRLQNECEKEITVTAKFIDNRLRVQVENTCRTDITFDGELPMTQKQGGGTGTKSILYTAERYDGTAGFSTVNGKFITRIVLNANF